MTIYNVKIAAEHRTGVTDSVYHFDSARTAEAFVEGVLALMRAQWQCTFAVFESNFKQYAKFDIDSINELNPGELEIDGFPDVLATIHIGTETSSEKASYSISISKFDTF